MASKTSGDIKELQKMIVSFNKVRDWGQFHTPKDVAISLVLEAGEVMEHFQWKSEAEVKVHIKKHKGEIADELADVLNYLLLMAAELDIDITKAFRSKLKKNAKKYPIAKAKGRHTKYTEL